MVTLPSPPPHRTTAVVAACFAVAAASSTGNALEIAPEQHFPLMPDIPIYGPASEPRRRIADGESMSSEVEDNFVLVMDDVSDFEDELLRNAVIGEPLTYRDDNLGRYEQSPRICISAVANPQNQKLVITITLFCTDSSNSVLDNRGFF